MEPISPERLNELQELEKRTGVPFVNQNLLNQSMTHSSYAHEKNVKDNERLEFLGDAVLKLVATEYIYNKFPTHDEGDLTKIRAAVISDETLSKVGQKLDLGEAMLLSQNEKKGGGKKRKSNLANAVEALIGAVYLDAGLGRVRDLIIENLRAEIEIVSEVGYIRDYKSTLQEYVQKHKWALPQYRVIKEVGPEHRRVFLVEAKINGQSYGVGRGNNKKEAEQRAAEVALKSLNGEEKSVAKKSPNNGITNMFSRMKKRLKIDDKAAD